LGLEKMYDASTGTYYCDGKRYSRTLIAEAKGYLYGEAQKYSSKGAEWRDLALVYDLAYEAVDSLTDANVEKLKAEKAKKGDQGA
ncbi:MAG: hypothetical protein J5966_03400, partial [Lachnospiraceae bacterium]|nr:hypothetical protein [Lachnospiraceae bacterium]